MKTETAPPVAICARCGCLCSGERVTVTMAYDRIARMDLPMFTHEDARACERAKDRSARFWTGAHTVERAA